MEIKTKNDIIKIISSVGDYLNGKDISDEYQRYFNESGTMYTLCHKIDSMFSKEEFENVLSITDPSRREMWLDIMAKFNEHENEEETEEA